MVDISTLTHGTELIKRGFAQMQEGGVIMDVVTPGEAHIAESAGALRSWPSNASQQTSEPQAG